MTSAALLSGESNHFISPKGLKPKHFAGDCKQRAKYAWGFGVSELFVVLLSSQNKSCKIPSLEPSAENKYLKLGK